MKNVTLSMNEELVKAGRAYAQAHHTTLNGLVRELLQKTVVPRNRDGWLEEAFTVADRAGGNSRGRAWRRKDAYERKDVP